MKTKLETLKLHFVIAFWKTCCQVSSKNLFFTHPCPVFRVSEAAFITKSGAASEASSGNN